MPASKPRRAKPKTPARRARAARRAPAAPELKAVLEVKKEGLEPILGAAYMMTDRAHVWLDGDRKSRVTVRLSPKLAGAEPSELLETFRRELETQKVRWAIAKNNQPIREYIVEQALVLAQGGQAPEAQADQGGADLLTDDQRQEIDKLIAEVEAEIKTMNEKKALPDPKGVKASWEEKQEAKPQAGPAPVEPAGGAA